MLHRIEVHTLRCAEGRSNQTHWKPSDFAPFSLSAGQRYIPHSGSQESDECRGPDGQGLVRGFHQVPEGVWNSSSQFSRSVMAHEGAGEKATREEGEAWGVSNPCAPRLAEETHLTSPSPQRVQGHGLFLILQLAKKKKKVPRIHPLQTSSDLSFCLFPAPVSCLQLPMSHSTQTRQRCCCGHSGVYFLKNYNVHRTTKQTRGGHGACVYSWSFSAIPVVFVSYKC